MEENKVQAEEPQVEATVETPAVEEPKKAVLNASVE